MEFPERGFIYEMAGNPISGRFKDSFFVQADMNPQRGRPRARREKNRARKRAVWAQEEILPRLELRKRAHHALRILESNGLTGQPLRECTIALAKLHAQFARKSAARAAVDSFPLTAKNDRGKSPMLYKNYLDALATAEREEYVYNVHFYKLALELGVIHRGQGEVLAHRVIRDYERSFLPHKK